MIAQREPSADVAADVSTGATRWCEGGRHVHPAQKAVAVPGAIPSVSTVQLTDTILQVRWMASVSAAALGSYAKASVQLLAICGTARA